MEDEIVKLEKETNTMSNLLADKDKIFAIESSIRSTRRYDVESLREELTKLLTFADISPVQLKENNNRNGDGTVGSLVVTNSSDSGTKRIL